MCCRLAEDILIALASRRENSSGAVNIICITLCAEAFQSAEAEQKSQTISITDFRDHIFFTWSNVIRGYTQSPEGIVD